jgi:addiction module RelE/StbE family toxin
MRLLKLTKQFKQHFKLARKDHRKDTDKLQAVIELLQEQGSLPSEYSPHPLTGN